MSNNKELAETLTDTEDFRMTWDKDFYRRLGFVFLEDVILRLLGYTLKEAGEDD